MTIFSTTTEPPKNLKADLLLLSLFEDRDKLESQVKTLDDALGGAISAAIKSGIFRGKLKEVLPLYTSRKIATPWIALVGLGKKTEYNLEKLRVAASATTGLMEKHKVKNLAILATKAPPQNATVEQAVKAMTESLLLSEYKFAAYKKLKKDERPIFLQNIIFTLNFPADRAGALRGATQGSMVARAVNYARDLANQPGNVMTPATLAQAAEKLADQLKLKCKVLEKTEIEKLKMGALLAVNQGSALPPKFIIVEYRGKKTETPVVLIGKGITFDSGGISLKPGKNMEEMKFDMSGAATVLGIIKATAELKLPQHLIGLIPATENLPSGSAIKPGDVVRAMSGKSIEIINTDAEGRMILADALAYAVRYKPKLVIDYATLTGAVVTALGTDYTGAFATNQKLMDRLQQAAEATGEKIWPLPLAPEYKEQIKSHLADVKNVGVEGQGAGAIVGALFLQEFISFPWIHLDIAGTAWTNTDKPYKPKGATGVGVRLTLEFLKWPLSYRSLIKERVKLLKRG